MPLVGRREAATACRAVAVHDSYPAADIDLHMLLLRLFIFLGWLTRAEQGRGEQSAREMMDLARSNLVSVSALTLVCTCHRRPATCHPTALSFFLLHSSFYFKYLRI